MISADFAPDNIQTKSPVIAVVGDIMLDQYVIGEVRRLAPEANAPVLSHATGQTSLGGAGFVARILYQLGASPLLCGVVGADAYSIVAKDLARAEGINATGMISEPSRPTTLKTRYQKKNDLLLRVDNESTDAISMANENHILHAIRTAPDLKAIIISDYGKGVVTPSLCKALITFARGKNIPVLVDPKGKDWSKYKGATILTPNVKELGDVCGAPVAHDAFLAPARDILAQYDLSSILVTRSEHGMDYVSKDEHVHADTLAKNVVTVVGAGDHVIAAMAIGLTLQKPIKDILHYASLTAAFHIEQGIPSGTHSTSSEPQTEWTRARNQIAEWQRLGLKVGFTNGCFDILHAGHVMYLNQAKQHCDRLVLGLNSDASVKILKGPSRPINNEQDRKDVMMGLKPIDDVVFFGATKNGDDNTPSDVISALKPDIFFKGGDYTIDQLPEAKAVLSYGGEVKILGLLDGRSTTNIIAKSQKS